MKTLIRIFILLGIVLMLATHTLAAPKAPATQVVRLNNCNVNLIINGNAKQSVQFSNWQVQSGVILNVDCFFNGKTDIGSIMATIYDANNTAIHQAAATIPGAAIGAKSRASIVLLPFMTCEQFRTLVITVSQE